MDKTDNKEQNEFKHTLVEDNRITNHNLNKRYHAYKMRHAHLHFQTMDTQPVAPDQTSSQDSPCKRAKQARLAKILIEKENSYHSSHIFSLTDIRVEIHQRLVFTYVNTHTVFAARGLRYDTFQRHEGW